MNKTEVHKSLVKLNKYTDSEVSFQRGVKIQILLTGNSMADSHAKHQTLTHGHIAKAPHILCQLVCVHVPPVVVLNAGDCFGEMYT